LIASHAVRRQFLFAEGSLRPARRASHDRDHALKPQRVVGGA
jgi:hypothetical protein